MTATNKHIPGKRLKTWHRKSATYKDGGSLRAFARFLAQDQNDDRNSRETARAWGGRKGRAMTISPAAALRIRAAIFQHAREAAARGEHALARQLFAKVGVSYAQPEAN